MIFSILTKLGHQSFNRACIRRGIRQASSMVRILNVAEKNDAAKCIADIMSGGRYRKREGFSKYNKIYEMEYNILNYKGATITMTSVSGHLLGFDFSGQYRKWQGCNPLDLFTAPLEKTCPDNYKDIKRTLEREIRGCQALVIWTDGDREGENIGFEIIQVCRAVKPNIAVYRARFSEITPQAIQRACNNLREPDKNTSDAVDVRSELDLRIGAAFTRFQTLRLQRKFPEVLSEMLISYGSCQFPTLGFVVERYKQVQAFVPEPFWKIKVSHQTDDGIAEFSWKRVRLFDHTACLMLLQHCLENPVAKVIDVKKKPKSKWRPQPLDTVELEKLSSRKLRINAKETMKIAEKLYTQGFISYPRTETNKFAKEIDLVGLVRSQTQDNNWGEFAEGVVNDGPNPRNGNKSDNAHPPIHPIKYTNNLQGNEARVYEFIVRHFLATCSRDAQGEETSVDIEINAEKFTCSGLTIIARNYLDVYPYDKWNAKIIPRFASGETFEPSSIEMVDGQTSPPSLLTEADLIALMEKNGIGTDATHAEHIETIKSRSYVFVNPDGKFVPGELGMGLVEGYDAMGFEMSKPHLRRELELGLTSICEGRRNYQEVLQEQINNYRAVFVEACNQVAKIDEALSRYFGEAQHIPEQEIRPASPIMKCPKCNSSDVVIRTKKDGKGLYATCMGYPDCKLSMWFPSGVLEASVDNNICPRCRPGPVHMINFKFKAGTVPHIIGTQYKGCINCDEFLLESLSLKKFSTPNTGATQPQNSRQTVPTGSVQRNRLTGSMTNNNSRQLHTGVSGYRPTTAGSIPTGAVDNRLTMAGTNRQTSRIVAQDGPSNMSRYNGPGAANTYGRGLNPASNNMASYGRGHNPGSNLHPAGRTGTGSTNDNEGCVMVCNCGLDTISLAVKKEGPNKGRNFQKCPKPQGSGCDFFQWADQPSNTGQTRMTNTSNINQHRNYNANSSYGNSSSTSSMCNCGQVGKLLTVQKEGPNQGRKFYTCPKPRGTGCGFFEWANNNSGPLSDTTNNVSEPGTKRKRKCGICKQEGHIRTKCPNK